ncbi:MAG: heparinase II/III-family protein [Opitutaceae bacterium]|nr:heparinase II/III-family protein [Opitutaceae bacterium]
MKTVKTTIPALLLLALLASPASPAAAAAPSAPPPGAAADVAAFKQQMLDDAIAAVSAAHETHARRLKSARAKGGSLTPWRGYAYTLSAAASLHAVTGEKRFLEWAAADLAAQVEGAQIPAGRTAEVTVDTSWGTFSTGAGAGGQKPFVTSFRNMVPFCEAYMHLKKQNALTAAQRAMVDAQIAASIATHYESTDFGAHNRGLIDGAAFLFAAAAVPDAPDVEKWKRFGHALAADSMFQWSIEDASIYMPFWQTYTLTLAELQGFARDHMSAVTTRLYFDQYRQLLMPNGLMPDWGDGDWTHSWAWIVANLVRAGSCYKDGRYLDAARRLYNASLAHYKKLADDAIYPIGLALRWLDASVPLEPSLVEKSAEVVDDLVSKKITFRGPDGGYALLNYRDEGPHGRFSRDYLNAQLNAFQEKPHHGHADENAIDLLMAGNTVLLADGGYRHATVQTWEDGWRADYYHNKIVARTGQMMPYEGDAFDYITRDRAYHAVLTEKIHFGNFGSLDYSRTRLVDRERGYTGDRIVLFAPGTGLYIIVDSILIDEPGVKVFANIWHPDNILKQGEGYVVSWPERIPIRKEYWPNTHNKELLIQFAGKFDSVSRVKEIERRFNPSKVFYQYLNTYFFKGQRLAFVTVLRPHDPGTFTPAMLEDVRVITGAHDDNRTLGLAFTLDGDPVTVGLKLDPAIGLTNLRGRPMFDWRTGSVTYGKLRTDSDFAFVREHKDGAREIGFFHGCKLQYDGKTLFDMPLNKHMYQGADDFRNPLIKDKMPRWHEIIK